MSNIVGTTTSVQKYLSKSTVKLTINPQSPEERSIVLPENRTYVIPAYQRELRWEISNVNVLLSDLISGPRFLGNVILSLKTNGECEIIDGQQRTTILQMIIACIKSKFGEEIDTLDCCKIENESFSELSKMISNGFRIDPTELNSIKEKDKYSQLPRFQELWQMLSSSPIIGDRYQASTLINNIRSSEVNIIASQSNMESESIRYFLDVNLKGVKLDKEDIFKGYLFKLSSQQHMKDLWKDVKQLSIKFNSLKDGSDNKRYPLMKIYEHFFYCDLFLPKNNGQDFSGVTFGEDFCLSQTTTVQSRIFYQGTHIIEIIQNAQYLIDSLQKIKDSLQIMIDVISSTGASDFFKSRFITNGSKINSVEMENVHCILKKTLLDKEIIPKVLALKYIVSFLDGNKHSKKEYKCIYSVFAAATIFTVFANKKESSTFYSFVKEHKWVGMINNWLNGYVNSHELTRGKVLATYSFSLGSEDSVEGQVRSKSLAAVFNYLKIQSNKGECTLNVTNCKGFNTFLTNSDKFSIEHFIMGERGTLKVKTAKYDFNYTYPATIKKYRNSLFNYVFIPNTLNNELHNSLVLEKVNIVKEHFDKIQCLYSRKYIELLENNRFFQSYPTISSIDGCKNEEEVKSQLDKYFQKDFPGELLEFSSALMKSLDF